jgi:hypothetical protein
VAIMLNSIRFASNGEVAAKNSSLLRLFISDATSLERISTTLSQPLLTSNHLTLIGCFPDRLAASLIATISHTSLSLKNFSSSWRAALTRSLGSTAPVLVTVDFVSFLSPDLVLSFVVELPTLVVVYLVKYLDDALALGGASENS